MFLLRIQKLLRLMAVLAVCSAVPAFDAQQGILAVQDAIESGNLTSASELIATLLSEHPRDGGVVNLRGVVHARRNELVAARSDFEEAVRLAPALTPAWKNLARACQIESGQNSSSAACAVTAWQRVTHLDPADAEAHSSLAKLYAGEGRFADSLRELKPLSAAVAQQTENVLVRCADLAGSGQVGEAQALASGLTGRADFSEEQWQNVRSGFDSAKAAPVVVTLVEGMRARAAAGLTSLQSLAVAYEQLGRVQDAGKTLELVAGLDPGNPAHLLELARLADASKDYQAALGYLAHARDLEPKNARIHFLFAMLAEKLNLPVEARASLTQALAIDPGNPAYNFAMGFVILSTRDAATAGSYFQKFVNAKPGEPKGHYALGIADFASGDFANSRKEMQRVETNPKTAGGAEYFLGSMARQEDDLSEAARHLLRSIELLPEFPESRTELARVYMRQGKLAEARKELEKAVRLDPQSFYANEQLLVLYRRTHDAAADGQAEIVKKLDEERSKRAELMLRTIEVRP